MGAEGGFGHALEAFYLPVSGAVGAEGGGGGGGGGFGHALEACKNFLCTAVSGGSRGRAGVGV